LQKEKLGSYFTPIPVSMSKYTVTSMIFVAVLFATIVLVQYDGAGTWIISIPILIYIFLLAYGAFRISNNFYFKSLCSAITDEKIIALTFDDGPDEKNTEALADLLNSYEAQATFFCIGKKIADNKNTLRKIDRQGHLIGNHSYSHSTLFDLYASDKMKKELGETNDLIFEAIGKKPLLFRPPYGVTNPALRNAVKQLGMQSIGWNLRSFDTVRNKEKVLRKLIKRTQPGAVALMHDTTEDILEITQSYLEWLKKEGYKVVSLEQLFNIHAYA
jgi:peptidoglycan/xylan/chitin deacetylase (PgdA/CDA1 family)